jgi:ureidoacrylate peracid hydrolase
MVTIFDPTSTALLVIDVQYDYCSPEGLLAKTLNYTLNRMSDMISRLPSFIEAVRKTGATIIFLRMIEDPEYMAPNAAAKIRAQRPPLVLCNPATRGFEYFRVSPLPEDIQLTKNAYDGFGDSALLLEKGIQTQSLEDVLRARQIDCLIFSGVLTSRCVDSTLRSAFRLGFNCIAVEDMVSMPDQLQFEHDAALNIWRTIFAFVTSASELRAI